MTVRYEGAEEYDFDTPLIRYLMENYTTKDGRRVSHTLASMCLGQPENRDAVNRGRNERSYVYMVGDKIAGREGWLYKPGGVGHRRPGPPGRAGRST
jgi:hypothetical protein